MSDVPGNGVVGVADELAALSARVADAKAGAEARAKATTPAPRQVPAMPASTPSEGRVLGPQSLRRNLILAVLVILLGLGATIVIADDDGPDSRLPSSTISTAITDAAAVSPTATGVPATAPIATGVPASALGPVAPGPAAQDSEPTASEPVPPPGSATPPDAAGTVVVEISDSFWSIAERQVASIRGGAPTTAEVATYWVELIDANQSQLVQGGNPNLIYPGQTFSLP